MASKHLAFAYPVSSEEEIKSILEGLRKEHHQANHVCYAWRLGWDKNRYRLNDDGEPSGTAGKPIFGQIQSDDLTNVLIAVVRYFGGTKLGTGGLIDAYKTSSRMAIDAGEVILKPVKDHYLLRFPYSSMPVVMKALKAADMDKLRTDFGENCEIEFLVTAEHASMIEAMHSESNHTEVVHLGRL